MGDSGGTVQNFITLSSNSDESINLIYPCVKEIWLFIKHPTGGCHHIALPELFRGSWEAGNNFFPGLIISMTSTQLLLITVRAVIVLASSQI